MGQRKKEGKKGRQLLLPQLTGKYGEVAPFVHKMALLSFPRSGAGRAVNVPQRFLPERLYRRQEEDSCRPPFRRPQPGGCCTLG